MHLIFNSNVDCICDFTYNFIWQHKGEELDPDALIPSQKDSEYTYRQLVETFINGEDVHISGSVGKRFASSLGVNLVYFGGHGETLDVGCVFVDGDMGTRAGISMVSGAIYVSGTIAEPMGNIVEVVSDEEGYRKYVSITDILQNRQHDVEFVDSRNEFDGKTLTLGDGILRDTVAARLDVDATVVVSGDVDLSTGILMRKGKVIVEGDGGMNTGVLLNGGRVVIMGSTGEFAGTDMRKGEIVIGGKAQGYLGANMKGGSIYVKGDVKAVPPAKVGAVDDMKLLQKELGINRMVVMMFKKISL
ncbi:MAG: formylmethanofuran dehydrogenase [Methanosarcinaceae archaeon]|nr:formylmethanofuran dehydrogenase [Methanosarcinaceae archaeon]